MADEKSNPSGNESNKSQPRLVVISGITSGIGEGLLHELIKRHHKVVGFGRNEEKIKQLREQYKIDIKKDPQLFAVVDITHEKKVIEWCQSILNTYGTPDMVINNAGSTIGGGKPVWDLDITKLKESYNIQIVGPVLLCKQFLPSMREKDSIRKSNDINNNNCGIIINIASWASINGVAELSPYVINKHGIEGLTRCLAKELNELNPNMACISVSPGWVNTGMLKGSYEAIYGKEIGLEDGLQWANKCCDWLLSLNNKHNGMSLGPPLEKESMKKYCDFVTMCGIPANVKDYIHPTGFENSENNTNDENDENKDTKDKESGDTTVNNDKDKNKDKESINNDKTDNNAIVVDTDNETDKDTDVSIKES